MACTRVWGPCQIQCTLSLKQTEDTLNTLQKKKNSEIHVNILKILLFSPVVVNNIICNAKLYSFDSRSQTFGPRSSRHAVYL